MQYKTAIPFVGNSKQAIEVARSVLANNNFQIDSLSNVELVAKGPGLNSTKENPLLGATLVKITVGASSIELFADLGGVRWMRNFVLLFPFSLALLLGGMFSLSLERHQALLAIFFMASPWLIVSPFMARNIKKKTINALERLLHNMKVGGR